MRAHPVRRALRHALPVGMLLLAVLCWRLSSQAAQSLRAQAERVTYSAPQGTTAAAYAAMQEAEQRALPPRAFALWGEAPAFVQEPLTQRRQQVRVLHVLGDTRLVLPVPETLAEGDDTGCIIDEATALALFQSKNVVGSEVRIGENTYIIRGVMQAPEGTVLLRPGREDALGYVSMWGSAAAEEFAMRHGLQRTPVQAGAYAAAAEVLARLPGGICLLLAVCLLRRAAKAANAYPLRYALALVACFCVATLCVLYVFRTIPAAYLPSRWSDFSQYARIGKEIAAMLEAYFMEAKQLPDRMLTHTLLQGMLGLVAAALLLLGAHMHALARLRDRLQI